jgi:hypothetical protein
MWILVDRKPLPMSFSRRVAPATIASAGLLLFVHAVPAAAYIDPGTGSALLYVISGILLSVYFAARGLYYRLLDLVFRVRFRDQRCAIALHCEDPRYEIIFLPIARALVARGIEPTIFTMYRRDDTFEALAAGVVHRAIPAGIVGYAHLNNLEADLLVTTTPQLDVMTFRRSRRVAHYAHVPHALGESRFVRPYAYDYFDSVLCCGPILKANIRRMESIRNTRPKELFETGIPHFEEIARKRADLPGPTGAPVVLVAPSWGPHGMFTLFGTGFVAEIAKHYRVIVRPHPQMKLSQPELYAQVLALPGVYVDTARDPATAMSAAHLLLSDISGIAHEFAFIYERPVLVVDRKMDVGGLEGEVLGGESELRERCRDFIVPFPPAGMGDIVRHVENALAGHSAARIVEARASLVYNFGRATDVAADQLAGLQRRVQESAQQRPSLWKSVATRVRVAR